MKSFYTTFNTFLWTRCHFIWQLLFVSYVETQILVLHKLLCKLLTCLNLILLLSSLDRCSNFFYFGFDVLIIYVYRVAKRKRNKDIIWNSVNVIDKHLWSVNFCLIGNIFLSWSCPQLLYLIHSSSHLIKKVILWRIQQHDCSLRYLWF